MRTALILLAFSASVAQSAQSSGKWRMQYFYDEMGSSLAISDLRFVSPSHGVAVAGLMDQKGKRKPVRLDTTDGGAHWVVQPVKEEVNSVFFADERAGWLVGPGGMLRTRDGGATWEHKKSPKGIRRVFFLDARHGWAVGNEKGVFESTDGGDTWKDVPAAAEPKSTAEYTAYNWVEFVNNLGIITGFSRPPRPGERSRHPDYMDPENPRRELPGMTIMLTTADRGKTWTSSTTSVFGIITKLKMTGGGNGLALFEFLGSFRYPSEVVFIDSATNQSKSVYRDRQRAVTDLAILPDGTALLAAVETPTNVVRSVVPGKVRILRSKDLAAWQDMDVDYRATASRVVLATAGKDVWAATDSGMILKLATE